ncbi:MAG: Asp-tRNA(Asn)/Glu-tRNA(Gln) amidotransferase subunit GatA [Firmicutes bacterium]|nr:Asp-tRNA(Asn)/Glu-tRNA(Gln) amidotransferase subunit GatA [Bacillota bacterium]
MIENKLNEFFNKKDEWNAFITICKDDAYAQAGKIEKKKLSGKEFPLEGMIAGVKDNICTKGVRTTCGSRMLENFVSPYDATAVKRLKESGAVIVGKTNMDEFAMGSTGRNSFFSQAKNPLNTNKTPGGSSGGSAAAVASGLVDIALGTDTGGSVRQPAAICGIVGFKPTYGRISRYGLIAYASSFDTIGIMAKTTEQIKSVYKCISGFDPKDSTSSKHPAKQKVFDTKALKIGIDKKLMEESESEIRQAVEKGIGVFEKSGAECEYFDFAYSELLIPVYFVTAYSQAASNLSRFDGLRYGFYDESIKNSEEVYIKNRTAGFGKEVKRRILAGNYFLTQGNPVSIYEKAQKCRKLIFSEYKKLFEKYDIIISPTYLGKTEDLNDNGAGNKFFSKNKYEKSLMPANICGFPAVSVPCGMGCDNMPAGLHMMSEKFTDEFLLDAADFYLKNKNAEKEGI